MFQVSLHINSQTIDETAGGAIDDWYNADLDPQVNIILKDSIKDAKDVGKVMTAYTSQFKLPASKTNNKIFKYFHNHNVLNGFDARRKHEAIIKLNGFDFKKGYIKLNKVNLKDNSPLSYDIQFFGELSSLKDILGNSDLKDLTSLAKYNHEYSLSNVRDGFEEGLTIYIAPSGAIFVLKDPDGDIKYPLISHTRLFEYDSQKFHRLLSEEEQGQPVTSSDRISYNDLKPAIRATRVIEAIEETFPQIKFDTSWIESSTANFGSPFDDLFMWLHRDKGYITYGQDIESKTFWANLKDGTGPLEYEYSSGDTSGILPLSTFTFGGGIGTFYECEFELTPDGGGENQIVVILINEGEVFDVIIENSSGQTTIEFALPFEPNGNWEIITQVFPANDVSNITPKLTVNKYAPISQGGNKSAVYGNVSISLVKDIIVPLLMPKKKIIDFLSDLFKMFNLVAYEDRQLDGTYKIFLESLDSFYRKGTSYDITQYIDISNSSVERVSPFGSVSLKFPEPKTFLAINQRQITGDDFGDVSFRVSDFDEGNNTSSSLLFDGGEYNIEPKFEKVMYERLINSLDDSQTNIQLGLYVNDNKENVPEPVIGEALLLYIVQEQTGSPVQYIKWSDGNNSTKYNRPSNVKADNSQTLHFNEEFDEWTLQTNPNSLFNNFYKTYISGIYSPYARRVVVDAYLPSLIFSKIKLNDSIIIADTVFLIDNITTNLTTGKTSLELLRVTDVETKYVVPTEGQETTSSDEEDWDVRTEYWEEIIDKPL
jgi:hypothetical protein